MCYIWASDRASEGQARKGNKMTKKTEQQFIIEQATDSDLIISGRGGREHSALYVALESMEPGQKLTGHSAKPAKVNNTISALHRAHPDRRYASRRSGSIVIRIS